MAEREGLYACGSAVRQPRYASNPWVLIPLLVLGIKNGGERGIRTPGTFRLNGFQDHRIRPLCHLSAGRWEGIDSGSLKSSPISNYN
jgi:hypothetical protein